jgi:hypothetical protein
VYTLVPVLNDPTGKLSNYTVTIHNNSLTVLPALLSVTAPSGIRRYGDATANPAPLFSGLMNNDNITAGYDATAPTVSSSVGVYTLVPVLNDPTGKLSNYTVTIHNNSFTVLPALLTVSGATGTRLYGAANPAPLITGVQNNENITATYGATAPTASSPVGLYSLVPVVSDPGGKLSNYTLTIKNGSITVSPALLSVTASSGIRKYGDATANPAPLLSGLMNNDNITAGYDATAPTASSPVGLYSLVPVVSDPTGKLSNYTLTIKNGSLSVLPAPLTLLANSSAAVRRYGVANPPPFFIGLLNNDIITAIYDATAPALTSPVGVYPLVPVAIDPNGKLSNYTLTTQNGSITVVPALLSVTAPSGIRRYGAATANPAPLLSPLMNNDNITASYDATAPTAASPAGTYTLVPVLSDPTGKLSNYTVTSRNGTLTVAPALLTIFANNQIKLLNAPIPPLTTFARGFVLGETSAVLDGTLSCTTTATASSPVGTYPITCSGQTGANYSITYIAGILTVH